MIPFPSVDFSVPAPWDPAGWLRPGDLPWVLAAAVIGGVLLTRLRRRGARLRAPALLASGMVAVAALGPVAGTRTRELPAFPVEVTLAVDVSRSMAVAAPGGRGPFTSRWDVGRDAALRILAGIPGAQVGVVAFGSSAHVLLPATGDRTVVRSYLEALDPGLLSTPGSSWRAVREAVAAGAGGEGDADAAGAVARSLREGARDRVVLVISDGEWAGEAPPEWPLDGPVMRAGAGAGASAGTTVHVLWTDRPSSGRVPGGPAGPGAPGDAFPGVDPPGSPASRADALHGPRVSTADPDPPRRLAHTFGGRVIPLSDPEALGRLAAELAMLGRGADDGEAAGTTPVDGGPLLAGLAALVLCGGLARWRTP